MWRRALLTCGIVSSVLYAAMNVFVPMAWPGYRSASRMVSELSAIEAPSRAVWVPLGVVYTLLVAMGLCARGFGPGFRAYTLVTMALLVAVGAVTGQSARVEADLPTPWLGVLERVGIGLFLIWIVVLATTLLREPRVHPAAAVLGAAPSSRPAM